MQAIGNVKIKNKNAFIESGKNASYFPEKNILLLTVKILNLNQKENKLYANKKIEFWRLENIAVATEML